jgi:hypothetical protein
MSADPAPPTTPTPVATPSETPVPRSDEDIAKARKRYEQICAAAAKGRETQKARRAAAQSQSAESREAIAADPQPSKLFTVTPVSPPTKPTNSRSVKWALEPEKEHRAPKRDRPDHRHSPSAPKKPKYAYTTNTGPVPTQGPGFVQQVFQSGASILAAALAVATIQIGRHLLAPSRGPLPNGGAPPGFEGRPGASSPDALGVFNGQPLFR